MKINAEIRESAANLVEDAQALFVATAKWLKQKLLKRVSGWLRAGTWQTGAGARPGLCRHASQGNG